MSPFTFSFSFFRTTAVPDPDRFLVPLRAVASLTPIWSNRRPPTHFAKSYEVHTVRILRGESVLTRVPSSHAMLRTICNTADLLVLFDPRRDPKLSA
jgi:hypothetical protein